MGENIGLIGEPKMIILRGSFACPRLREHKYSKIAQPCPNCYSREPDLVARMQSLSAIQYGVLAVGVARHYPNGEYAHVDDRAVDAVKELLAAYPLLYLRVDVDSLGVAVGQLGERGLLNVGRISGDDRMVFETTEKGLSYLDVELR